MLVRLRGASTSLACPPDTIRRWDEPGLVEMLEVRARNLPARVSIPLGALTKSRPAK